MNTTAIRITIAVVATSCSASNAPLSMNDVHVDVVPPVHRVLSLTPPAVDFHTVSVGKRDVATVLVENTGDVAVDVAQMVLSGSNGFAIDAIVLAQNGECSPDVAPVPLALPLLVGVGAGVCVSIAYEPGDGGLDAGVLTVEGPSGSRPDGAEGLALLSLSGVGLDPEITFSTAVVDFGTMAFGESKELSFTIGNGGNEDLVIASVGISDGASAIANDVEILTSVAPGTVIPPASRSSATGSVEVTLRLQTGYQSPVPSGGVTYIEIHSNDRDEPVAYVKVVVAFSPPSLLVTPYPVVDFGSVLADSGGVTRDITFRNRGAEALSVSGIELVGPSHYEYTIESQLPDPIELDPNEERTVTIRYENPGTGQTGLAQARLDFTTSASDSTLLEAVRLEAIRQPPPRCEIVLLQGKVDFGVVAFGYAGSGSIDVMNIGDGPCSPFTVMLDDGPSSLFPGLPGGACRIPSKDDAQSFVVTQEPWGIQDILLPGESAAIELLFLPKAPIWPGVTPDATIEYRGIVHVTMLDFSNPDIVEGTTFTVVSVPGGNPGVSVDCNLEGEGSPALLHVEPTEVSFDLTAVGCTSPMRDIVVENPGESPVRICGAALEGCDGNVVLSGVPTFQPCVGDVGGLVLAPSGILTLGLTHVPTSPTVTSCELVLISGEPNAPTLSVQMEGEATNETMQTDTFVQLSGQDLDVLLVFDDSVSLTMEASHRAAEMEALAVLASGWASSVHIGVITTLFSVDVGKPGHLVNAGGATPRFVTGGASALGLVEVLESITHQSGPPDGGLEAARLALTTPLTDGPSEYPSSCTNDGQCIPPYACVQSVFEPGTFRCAGPNWEFSRPSAALEIVFIAISEDGSPGELDDYVAFFENANPAGAPGFVRAHAVVGNPGTGCAGPTGKAFPGDRYAAVASALGGKVHSICDAGWAGVFEKPANDSFGKLSEFHLSRQPVADSIAVNVSGSACVAGWEYLEDVNAITLESNGACWPEAGEVVTIQYDAECLPN